MQIISLDRKDKTAFIKTHKNIYKIKVISSSFSSSRIVIYIYNTNRIIELNQPCVNNKPQNLSQDKFENEVKSPIEGKLIWIYNGEVGVLKNQTLAIVESMKMENEITATNNLVLKKVCVKIGDLIKQGQTLLLAQKEEKMK